MSGFGLMHDGLSYWARRFPDKPAFAFGDQTITYAELAKWSGGVAQHLQSCGVVPGDRVAIAASNSLDWVAAAFGIALAGAIIVPFNDRLVGEELAYLATDSDPKIIIADDDRRDRMVAAGVPHGMLSIDMLGECRGGPDEDWREVRPEAEDVAMIIFTSGSTSRPKGAMMTHGSYLLKFLEMRLLDDRLGTDTRALMPFGLHSSPGLPWGIMFTTILGGTLHFLEKYNAEAAFETLRDKQITFFIGVPMIYDQIASQPDFGEADLSALTFARIGGATPSAGIIEKWREKGIALRQLYGMSEVGGGALIATEQEAHDRPECCGRGLAFSRVRILRDDGSDCAVGEQGHVLLRGPGLMKGYWNKPEETKAALREGWMHTGDIGVVDEDGYFRFVDRSKEMIKSGGFNVSPAEIESVIARHDKVHEVAVFGVSDDVYAEAIFACVQADASLGRQDLFDWCCERMAGYKLPRFIEITDQPLPRLANEKIDRRRLKELYADAAQSRERLKAVRA